ncbi:RNA polymerase sigma factor SigM [Knoellia sinensis KCTC 19936]|uniref:RNA polymerase sigma factor SigM n=1 Tax=Knoellia sinensis KCTC 19936 TaxID=1385520 RepID=A0A0A0J189_9MICO|nr:RNA polymerase sigma factor SigM [Knoellia sinensis]KGN31170.1 RNA polymerase sigma factor SigM [Knoellia sinensis KCTC 19936]
MSDLEGVDDRALMARHVAGDPDAFGEIFRRHRDRLWAVAVRTTGDRELASDCVQDGFVNAFRRAGSYRGDAAVSTWLHRIVVNACLDRLRRERDVLRRAGDVADIDIVDDHDRHDQAETELDVRAALAHLPEHQRLALVLVDMHGMPVADAADVLGVAVGTIKSRCARGREALAAVLGGRTDPAAREPQERP